jgi:hypothetical protein
VIPGVGAGSGRNSVLCLRRRTQIRSPSREDRVRGLNSGDIDTHRNNRNGRRRDGGLDELRRSY